MAVFMIAQAEAELEALIEKTDAGQRVFIVSASGRLFELQPLTPDEQSTIGTIADA